MENHKLYDCKNQGNFFEKIRILFSEYWNISKMLMNIFGSNPLQVGISLGRWFFAGGLTFATFFLWNADQKWEWCLDHWWIIIVMAFIPWAIVPISLIDKLVKKDIEKANHDFHIQKIKDFYHWSSVYRNAGITSYKKSYKSDERTAELKRIKEEIRNKYGNEYVRLLEKSREDEWGEIYPNIENASDDPSLSLSLNKEEDFAIRYNFREIIRTLLTEWNNCNCK